MGKFFRGYGESGLELAKRIHNNPVEPPPEFIAFKNRLLKLLLCGLVLGSLLPLIGSLDAIRNAILGFPFVADLAHALPFFRSICIPTKLMDVFKFWYLVMFAYCFAFLLYFVISCPYRTMKVMGQRIQRIRDHLLGVCVGVLFSVLYYHLMFNPSRQCEDRALHGHADLIFHAMTSTHLGLSLFGPIVWGLVTVTWTSTIFLAITLIARCFSTKN